MNKLTVLFILLCLIIISLLFYIFYRYNIKRKTTDSIKKILQLRENKTISEDFINFPKYYINLDRNENRRKNIEKEINIYGLKNIKRIRAFDGKKINSLKEGTIDGYNYFNSNDTQRRKAELAITMSHLKAIHTAKQDGNDYALIMEDDNEFTLVPHWGKTINQILKEIPSDCDMLLLSTVRGAKKIEIVIEDEHLNGVAYIITYKGMEKLSKYLNGNTFNFHNYDSILWDGKIIGHLKIYSTNKTLFLPFNFKFGSENTPDHKNQVFCERSYNALLKYF